MFIALIVMMLNYAGARVGGEGRGGGMRGRGGCQLFFPLGRETLQSKVSHRRPLSTNQFSFSWFYFFSSENEEKLKGKENHLNFIF